MNWQGKYEFDGNDDCIGGGRFALEDELFAILIPKVSV